MACAAPLAAAQADWRGVTHPARARVDYMLKCQGCHQPGGIGNPAHTPPLTGQVAQFLAVPGGREFLGRVPGVASTDLDDERLAELLNWTLYRFDAGHLPSGFQPYTAAEVGALRKIPLRLERLETRNRLLAEMERVHEK
ncbi:MAG: cytochrome C [Sphingomonadales bacterium]|nr:cytochrome C [Sphingomonadales bacterium]